MNSREWWRGSEQDDRLMLRRDIEEATKDAQGERFDRLMVGSAAYKLLNQVADIRPEQVITVFAQVITDIELRIRQETKAFLSCSDPGSIEARQHHFNARVAGAMIGLLNELVRMGDEAAQQINNQGEEKV